MTDLKGLKLKELRKLYPAIKARSVDEFLTELAEAQELEGEIVVEVDGEVDPSERVLNFIVENIKSNKKILVKTPTTMDADNLFAITQFELFPALEKRGISIVASSSRRDMSINGTLYVRYSCQSNHALVSTLTKFTDFLDL